MVDILDQIISWVQLIGIPVAAFGIFLNARSADRARNLQITLSIVDSFSDKWESGWRTVVRETVTTLKENSSASIEQNQLDKIFDILNYIDWVGRMIKDGHFKRPKTVFLSIGPRVKTLIEVMQPIIDEHTTKQGREIWGGLNYFYRKI